jgi:hypothetical protein
MAPAPYENSTYTVVVDSLTTYCPYATVLTVNDQTITVAAPTTLTITDCPCTVVTTAVSVS